MTTEFALNYLEGDWWFDLGISYQKVYYHEKHKRVISIAVIFFTVYIRW